MDNDGASAAPRGALAVWTAVVGLVAVAFTLQVQWANRSEQGEGCSISGTAFYEFLASGRPAAGVELGWAPDAGQDAPGSPGPAFRPLATVAADGTFSASCTEAADQSDGSFELLYRMNGSGPEPCSRVGYTGIRFTNPGLHEGVNVRIFSRC